MSPPVLTGSSRSIYLALLTRAAVGGLLLMSRVLNATRQSMSDDAQGMKNSLERDHLALCIKLLDAHTPKLCGRYPKALEKAFQGQEVSESRFGEFTTQSLRLDQLELMDDAQVRQSVEVARALQHVLLVAQPALASFDAHVSALRGRKRVAASHNPMRPEAYLVALQSVMSDVNVPVQVRMTWLQHLAGPLGEALGSTYAEWGAQLQSQGVPSAALPMLQRSDASPLERAPASFAANAVGSPQRRHAVLTLERLRRLMAGDLEAVPSDPQAAFAREFSREFEAAAGQPSSAGHFEATVPAAFEALQDMQQLDQLVQRMSQQPDPMAVPAGSAPIGATLREQLSAQAQGMAQVLSLEVVALMVDNLVQDTRLLASVRDVIGRLEPALLRLVMVDARFFIDKQHPARRLLQEISQRGLAFGSVDDSHFNAFMVSLQRFVSPLASLKIDSAEPFDEALESLMCVWDEAAARTETVSRVGSAVAALRFAEDRNLLAEKMVAGMQSLAGLRQVPQSLVDFLCGPWAQAMACAQLKDQTGSDDPGGYKALVNTLLWSAQPDLTRRHIDKLTRLVPQLLSGLREGLRLIDYPSTKTSVFFDVLMKLHQQAFRPAISPSTPSGRAGLVASLQNDDHWVAPAEAKASGFMALPDEMGVAPAAVAEEKPALVPEVLSVVLGDLSALSVGSWVELQVKGLWTRTQLSWVSPQRTMYLFTSVQGNTQSMTQRMLERLLNTGMLRVLAEQSMVDHALDAVVHTAMLNSLDLRLG